MGIFGSFAISASGMDVERTRLEVAALNLANARTTSGSGGSAFQRHVVVARAASAQEGGVPGGVQVAAVVPLSSPGRREYVPGHPDADAEGFVTMPDVDPVTEMVEVMMATRGFEANTAAFAAARDMASRAIDIGRA